VDGVWVADWRFVDGVSVRLYCIHTKVSTTPSTPRPHQKLTGGRAESPMQRKLRDETQTMRE